MKNKTLLIPLTLFALTLGACEQLPEPGEVGTISSIVYSKGSGGFLYNPFNVKETFVHDYYDTFKRELRNIKEFKEVYSINPRTTRAYAYENIVNITSNKFAYSEITIYDDGSVRVGWDTKNEFYIEMTDFKYYTIDVELAKSLNDKAESWINEVKGKEQAALNKAKLDGSIGNFILSMQGKEQVKMLDLRNEAAKYVVIDTDKQVLNAIKSLKYELLDGKPEDYTGTNFIYHYDIFPMYGSKKEQKAYNEEYELRWSLMFDVSGKYAHIDYDYKSEFNDSNRLELYYAVDDVEKASSIINLVDKLGKEQAEEKAN